MNVRTHRFEVRVNSVKRERSKISLSIFDFGLLLTNMLKRLITF